jgi:hypothetical protein
MRRVLLRLFGLAVTFHLVALAWIFFRCESLSQAQLYLRGMLGWTADTDAGARLVAFSPSEIDAALLLMGLLVVGIDLPQAWSGHKHEVLLRWPLWLRVALMVVLGACILFARNPGQVPFIYFQF